jgi:hypothetical protein
MAWEIRGRGGRYYYRSCRVGSRVRKIYFGKGPAAEAAAREDQHARGARRAAREAARLRREGAAAIDALVAIYLNGSADIIQAALLEAGYHQHHRGEWRRRHAQDTGTT